MKNKSLYVLLWCLWLVLAFATTLFWAWGLQVIWAWLIVPCFGAPPLTIAAAVGAGTVYDYMVCPIAYKLPKNEGIGIEGRIATILVDNIIVPLVAVGTAFVYKIMLGL